MSRRTRTCLPLEEQVNPRVNLIKVEKLIKQLSGGSTELFLERLIKRLGHGDKFIKTENVNTIVKGIKEKYQNASQTDKRPLLSLVSTVFTRKQLQKKFNWKVTSKTHSKSKTHAEEIGIGKPRPPIKRPISKQELSDEWKSRIAAHAEENSRASPNESVKVWNKVTKQKETVPKRYLTMSIRSMYTLFRIENEEWKHKETTFRKNLPKNLKRAKNRGEYYFHRNVKNSQYEFNSAVKKEMTKNPSAVIVCMDYKANITLGQSREVLSQDYRNPITRTCFNITLLYYKDEKFQKKHYNFISDYMDHNSIFVVYVVKKLMQDDDFFNSFDKYTFFTDGGPNHFKTLVIDFIT